MSDAGAEESQRAQTCPNVTLGYLRHVFKIRSRNRYRKTTRAPISNHRLPPKQHQKTDPNTKSDDPKIAQRASGDAPGSREACGLGLVVESLLLLDLPGTPGAAAEAADPAEEEDDGKGEDYGEGIDVDVVSDVPGLDVVEGDQVFVTGHVHQLDEFRRLLHRMPRPHPGDHRQPPRVARIRGVRRANGVDRVAEALGGHSVWPEDDARTRFVDLSGVLWLVGEEGDDDHWLAEEGAFMDAACAAMGHKDAHGRVLQQRHLRHPINHQDLFGRRRRVALLGQPKCPYGVLARALEPVVYRLDVLRHQEHL
mmetsp:Transcript_23215/g.39887  ORF Transcript_23215/g.39887 Transcript_23215/m.39887 type:complete len:310 (+) Transcript_23215:153-1082(+)